MFLYPTLGPVVSSRYTPGDYSTAALRSDMQTARAVTRESATSQDSPSGSQRFAINGRETLLTYRPQNGQSVSVHFADGSMFVGTFFDSKV